jgi:quercetin dioxygenase-like cupin family protein
MPGLGTQPTTDDIAGYTGVDQKVLSRTMEDAPPNTVIHMDDLPWVAWIDPKTGEKNTKVISKPLLPEEERYGAAIVWTEPGFTSTAHWHKSDTLYVVLSGEWEVEGEGTYRPGDYRWVQAGTAYGVESTGTGHAEILLVSFGPGGRFDPDEFPPPNGDTRDRPNAKK